MIEPAVPRPKRRRRWLLALLPMVLLGFGWWWSTRPAPLPKFLEPFRDRLKLLDKAHQLYGGRQMLVTRTYAVEALPEGVFASLIRAENDEIGWSESAQGSQIGEMVPMVGFKDGYLSAFTLPDGSRIAVVCVDTIELESKVDATVATLWPGWYEVKFGRGSTDRFLAPEGWQLGYFSRKGIQGHLNRK
ncbi:MAG: hypothetical protein ABL949_12040 [Fimbriimonadaceae bacterium]